MRERKTCLTLLILSLSHPSITRSGSLRLMNIQGVVAIFHELENLIVFVLDNEVLIELASTHVFFLLSELNYR